MAKKFIPNGDMDFVTMAESFARTIAKGPARYGVSQDDAEELTAAVEAYRAALQASRAGVRSPITTRVKEDARLRAEQIIRRLAHGVRVNPNIDVVVKMELGLREREKKAKVVLCPQEPPRLRFVRALHEGGGATPMHELEFRALEWGVTKPAGAVRLELFVDLVPPEEPIPKYPGTGVFPGVASRPWYLRSYTRSPITLVPPMARVPMRVVYWGRWADSLGNVGPFSATAVGWVEGGMHLPQLAPAIGGSKPVQLLEVGGDAGAGDRGERYRVVVLEAQVESLGGLRALPVPGAGAGVREVRQIEGPGNDSGVDEAA